MLLTVVPVPVPRAGVLGRSGGLRSLLTALPHVTNTTLANVSGHPAISVPAGLDGSGLPVGAQLIARRGREDLLLCVAAQLERLAPWPLSPMATVQERGERRIH